jgi:hypothetical protein
VALLAEGLAIAKVPVMRPVLEQVVHPIVTLHSVKAADDIARSLRKALREQGFNFNAGLGDPLPVAQEQKAAGDDETDFDRGKITLRGMRAVPAQRRPRKPVPGVRPARGRLWLCSQPWGTSPDRR